MEVLANAVRELPFRQRFVVLDVVHAPEGYPKDDTWAKTRVLYPSSTLYRDLAHLGECVVLGSCDIGAAVNADEERAPKKKERGGSIRVAPESEAESRATFRSTTTNQAAIKIKSGSTEGEGTGDEGAIKPVAKLRKVKWNCENKKKLTRHLFCENALAHAKCPPLQYAEYSSLTALKRKHEAEKRRAAHRKKLLEQKKRRAAKEQEGDRSSTDDEDEETSAGGGDNDHGDWNGAVSIFGEAFIDALQGDAASPDESDLSGEAARLVFGAGMVTMRRLFQYLDERVTPAAAAIRVSEEVVAESARKKELSALLKEAASEEAAMKKWRKAEAKRLRDDPPRPGQHVVLWSYHRLLGAFLNCFPSPTPPPSCTTPVATCVAYRSIDIAWEVPEYDGEPVLYFEVQRRELTKLTHTWETICAFRNREGGTVNVTKTKLKIPHLVPGVEIQFRLEVATG
jgi:hypothetical protein